MALAGQKGHIRPSGMHGSQVTGEAAPVTRGSGRSGEGPPGDANTRNCSR
jgi:hypothetical protein